MHPHHDNVKSNMNTSPCPVDNLLHILPEWKILFLNIPKSGCTTLARMMAQAHGASPAPVESSARPERARESLIHDPQISRIPLWKDQDSRMKKRSREEAGWWRIALVRDPFARFFSAWVDKILLRAPGTRHLWNFTPDVLNNNQLNVSAMFRTFAQTASSSKASLTSDWHFTPQHVLIQHFGLQGLEVIPLSRIQDVAGRLAKITGRQIDIPAYNKSLQLDYRSLYDSNAIAVVRDLYADDLGCDPAVAPPSPATGPDMLLSRLETELVMKVRESSERIYDLSRLVVFPRLVYKLQTWVGRRP